MDSPPQGPGLRFDVMLRKAQRHEDRQAQSLGMKAVRGYLSGT